jgi:drug/metabolite transporter (DMT)-like permease
MQQPVSSPAARRLAFLAALLAGACWGVSFLAPRALGNTPSTTLALFRFLFFALSSVVALGVRRLVRPKVDGAAARAAVGLSIAGFSLYYALLAYGVKGIGITFATSIIALLPLTILLAATPRHDWRKLALPMALVLAGGIAIPLELYDQAYARLLERSVVERTLGLLATLSSLGLWTFFAIRNSSYLRKHPEWNPLDWAGVLGVGAGVTAAILFFAVEGANAVRAFEIAVVDPRVLLWTGFMGIAGAWGAIGLWNYASRVLAAGELGLLLVFEAVFGLVFGFIYEKRGPTFREAWAAGALIGGAILGIRRLAAIRTSGRSNSGESVRVG